MMDRPHIVCHMVTSLDGKLTGFELAKAENKNGVLILNYKRK